MLRKKTQKEPIPLLDLAMLAVVAGFFSYSGYTCWKAKPRGAALEAPLAPRAIASLSAPPPAAVAEPERSTFTLHMECLGSSSLKPLRTQANLLRVEGKLCGRSKKVAGRNLTTEEEMQIFHRPGKFTSHYFPLMLGRNRIVLDDVSAKAAKSQEIEVTREP